MKPVEQILVDDKGRAIGVVLQDGTEIRSRLVLSNATPHHTFLSMTPKVRLHGDQSPMMLHICGGLPSCQALVACDCQGLLGVIVA